MWRHIAKWTPGRYVPPADPPAQPVAALPVATPFLVPTPSVSAPAVPAPVEQAMLPARPAPAPRQVMLRTGMTIPIRVDESLSSERSVVAITAENSSVSSDTD